MEEWQRKYIWQNLSSLIENTICTAQFISKLTPFLSKNDDELLEAKAASQGRLAQSKVFYDIALQRAGMYTPLTFALYDTKQTGAFIVLLKGFMEVPEDDVFQVIELGNTLSSTLFNEDVQTIFKSAEVQISHSWYNNSHYRSEKIKSFQFSDSRLVGFLELLVSKHSHVLTTLLVSNMTKEFISKWIYACVMDNHFSLLSAAVERGIIERVFESKYLLFLAVTYSDARIIDLIVSHYIKQSMVPLQRTMYEYRYDKTGHATNYSILDVALLRGSVPVVQTLLKNTFDVLVMELAIHRCVVDTQFLPDDKINDRKRIIELILQQHPTLIKSRGETGSTSLHYPKIHIDLIIYLINLGVDVHATNQDSTNILHLCPNYMTPEEYDKLITHLHAKGESKIFLTLDRWQSTPLHIAVQHLEMLNSTVEMFLAAKVNFNAVSSFGNTPIFIAVGFHRSERVLHSLIHAGTDFRSRGEYNRTILHFAADKDNLTALRFFISRGCDVNAADENNLTPLHLALNLSKIQTHEIVKELVENGANVNALYEIGLAPLHYAFERYKKGELENRTIELLREAGAK